MKALHLASILFFAASAVAQNKSAHFKGDITFGSSTVFTTFFDLTIDSDNQFTIHSPKDADVRIFGGKAKLGRAMGKSPKKGIFVAITGEQQRDSLFGQADIPMIGKLKFKGIFKDNKLTGALLRDEKMVIGSLNGTVSSEKAIDYAYLYPIFSKTVRDNIYSTAVLQHKEWQKFDREIKDLFKDAQDDIELFLGFSMLSQQLPFSHFNFMISKPQTEEEDAAPARKTVFFEEKNESTAYLQIKDFSTSAEELAAIMPKIVLNENYRNLIVDLRNNPGGGIEAAFEFAKHIINEDVAVGYFVTNKLTYSGYQPELFKKLPQLQPVSTDEFTDDLKTSSGAQLIFRKSATPVFSGNIYVLTNGKTASTSEPVVYTLKSTKKAVVIGEKTAGAMLAAVSFNLSGKYNIVMPIADFYTADGVRLDQVGVSPDIETKSDDALAKALELIEAKSN